MFDVIQYIPGIRQDKQKIRSLELIEMREPIGENRTMDTDKENFRSAPPAYLVPAVDRAFRILELLKTEGREMTLMEIAKATGWHKSSIHKLLITLKHHGVLERDPSTKRYYLGISLANIEFIQRNSSIFRK